MAIDLKLIGSDPRREHNHTILRVSGIRPQPPGNATASGGVILAERFWRSGQRPDSLSVTWNWLTRNLSPGSSQAAWPGETDAASLTSQRQARAARLPLLHVYRDGVARDVSGH